MKNNISGIILLLIFFSSCNKREDYFHNINKAPTLTLSNGLTSISDSVKIGWLPFTTTYKLEDEEKLTVKATQSKGPDNLEITDNTITVYGITEGINNINVTAEDSYKTKALATIKLVVFRNVKPLAKITVAQEVGLSSYEVYINAKNSIDIDSRFGGKIVMYEYRIGNNYLVQTELSEIRYIFDTPGQKQIAVRVKDNDGDWSDEVVQFINIQ